MNNIQGCTRDEICLIMATIDIKMKIIRVLNYLWHASITKSLIIIKLFIVESIMSLLFSCYDSVFSFSFKTSRWNLCNKNLRGCRQIDMKSMQFRSFMLYSSKFPHRIDKLNEMSGWKLRTTRNPVLSSTRSFPRFRSNLGHWLFQLFQVAHFIVLSFIAPRFGYFSTFCSAASVP